MNNKGKDNLNKIRSDLKQRETWNYKVAYDGLAPYQPPTHIPYLPTKEKRITKSVLEERNKSLNFISVQNLDESDKKK